MNAPMRTLILNGSPKPSGDVSALLNAFVQELDGEKLEISLQNRISPCCDCRYCWSHEGCAIPDGMQEIYSYFESSHNVVLASPVWFSSLSGPLLNLASRMQTYFAASFKRMHSPAFPMKNGVLLLAGAQPGTEKSAIASAQVIFKTMRALCPPASIICSMNTDQMPAQKDEEALEKCREAARRLGKQYAENRWG